jgi:hypothetical protein
MGKQWQSIRVEGKQTTYVIGPAELTIRVTVSDRPTPGGADPLRYPFDLFLILISIIREIEITYSRKSI